jgi:hypothetical protein
MAHITKVPSLFLISLATVGLMTGCASSRNQTKVQTTTETQRTQSVTQAESPNAESPNIDPVMTDYGVSTPATSAAGSPAMARPETESANIVSNIEFNKGQKTLSPEATAELNKALSEARTRGQVEGVDIIVWSDRDAAVKSTAAQSRSQIEIARQRGENIEKYVDRMEPDAFVQVHNMATRPDAFMNYLNAQDEMTKEKLASAGLAADPATDEIKGHNSSAVILIKMK